MALTDAQIISNIHDENEQRIALNALQNAKEVTEVIYDASGTPVTTGNEGDWRHAPVGTGLAAQRFESGVWVTKGTYTA